MPRGDTRPQDGEARCAGSRGIKWTGVLARTAGLIALVAAVLLAHRCTAFTPMADRPAPGSPSTERIRSLLDRVQVIPERPDIPGYERDCGPGGGCVFGSAWTDATSAPLSHNGCDTRNDVLARAMSGVRFRPGTGRCVVVAGLLDDPYTGSRITFRKSDAGKVQIDHVIPLAAAWDLGAHTWTPAMRRRFANDTDFELLAVDGPANMRKSDSTPQDWIPGPAAYRCFYAAKYLAVAVRYSLPITAGDRTVLAHIADRCG
ncbi:HNH endonuclease family protein [Tomitella cavernea]|uniref:GmrSD restriction endonucleases C-terminal domain-containing protein n=1 Tax=Tomitella cavernea TaxID=1387982 RepID=A0ABP9CRC3_9ACTN|nr:HNH endonuclease family protein [Tomitella cavernea]